MLTFKIIYSLFPLLLVLFYYIYNKTRKNVSWNITKGEICYSCKQSLELEDSILVSRILNTHDFKSICKSCNRNNKILQLQRPFLKWKFKVQNFLISNKFSKFYFTTPVVILIIILIDFISFFTHHKLNLWWLYGTLNIFFYCVIFLRLKYTSVNK